MICNLCGNYCGVDREKSVGRCGVKENIKIARKGLHMYEEPCISGKEGSGTVFFCGCSLKCPFCQNYPVSRNQTGKEITPQELADIFRSLEDMGANNINLVSPTHFVREIAKAVEIYRPKVPIVYNSHGYDSPEALEIMNGIVDIYLPDFKYFDDELALKISGVKIYRETALEALRIMRSQTKDEYDDRGMMKSGMIIRHLILPKHYTDSINVLKCIKERFPETLVSVMSQYTPFGNLKNFPELNRKLFSAEIERVQNVATELDIKGFFQDREAVGESFIPKWEY